MKSNRKEKIHSLLKGIETGDAAAVAVVNEDKYIQHNPQTQEGGEGLAKLFKRISKSSPRVNIIRIFEDGDYVFAHTEYDFSSRKIGFEVFRFEGDYTVEHWDNIQEREGPNSSGHSMVDGPVEVTDSEKTEANRKIVHSFIDEVLIKGKLKKLEQYISKGFIEHNPNSKDGISNLSRVLTNTYSSEINIKYEKNHRLLADGNFVLSVNEGLLNGLSSSFYDLFRIEDNMIVEHWDTTEVIPPRSKWKNDNGKF